MKHLIWDLPTRFFHWLLFVAVVGAFGLAQLTEKDSPAFYGHVIFGVLAGLLIAWRFIWGFIGSRHAKWREFFFSPALIIEYFKSVLVGKGTYHAGHNPGSAPVLLAILLAVPAVVLSGLFITEFEVLEDFHEVVAIGVIFLALAHVAGVLVATKMNHENYTLAMVTGYKRAQESDAIKKNHFVGAFAMLILVLGAWVYFIKGFDLTTGLFKAPGTGFSLQIGEPEARGETESEGDD